MSVFKCKMCGGTIEFEQGASVGVCDSCGTKQTLPKLDDERRANLYDRANHFRRNNDFDKASGIYEQILNEDNSDAEAYWSLVLCRYGIEYVEDPASHKRVPTVNRAQFTSVFDDDNYKSALANADGYQRVIYEEEANTINDIQKRILAISQKEEPFDVFICYKESDASGRRTQDSVLANDLYHQLTAEGFKVFFSRITLEDKLGSAYEPYIFAALNSAKVMVVLGTKPEYFNAVWVKNEWSRYMALVKASNGNKMLIPAYRDMDPYDLPDEFSHLQAQDMSKLGFMQDLIRGIKKIVSANKEKAVVKETVVVNAAASADTAPLLKRAFIYLEDRNWESADEYCERVLDREPENAQAYLGKLLAEYKCRELEDLEYCHSMFDHSNNYLKVIRYGEEGLKSTLNTYLEHIAPRLENERLSGIYDNGLKHMKSAVNESDYMRAAEVFHSISGFQDADAKAEECKIKAEEKAEAARAEEEQRRLEKKRKLEEERIASEKLKKKRKRIIAIKGTLAVVCIATPMLMTKVFIPSNKYNKALSLEQSENYEDAIVAFEKLEGYKDSEEQIEYCQQAIPQRDYNKALSLEQSENYEDAIVAFEKLEGYKDSEEQIEYCQQAILQRDYDKAMALYTAGKLEEAYAAFGELSGYKDSVEQQKQIFKQEPSVASIGQSIFLGSYEQDCDRSNGTEVIEWIVLDKQGDNILVISKYALDRQDYRKNIDRIVPWETCYLRKWLNDDFLKAAFNQEEQDMIVTTTVSADKNPEFDIDPGSPTNDKVFLLSITEVEKYFLSDEDRKAAPTEYAIQQKATISYNSVYTTAEGKATCLWYLRTPGDATWYPARVSFDGSVNYRGWSSLSWESAVRPALWITLNP